MDFKNHLKSYLDEATIDLLLKSLEEESTHALLLNTEKIDRKTFESEFKDITPHPIVKNGYLYNKEQYSFGKHIYHELGVYYLQEPSAMVVSSLLNPKEGDLVLDMCAAPGGKTIQASLLMNNKGLIVSNDISKPRAESIKENVERMGRGNVLVISNDFSSIHQYYKQTFDKIILDAPCSGSGMFRKDHKVKDDWSYNKVIKYASLQKELILMAYSMLKPGGILSYSTCSFSKEEDEDVISYLFDKTDAQIKPIENNPLFYKGSNNIGIHLFPFLFKGEGHYICLIQKPGTLKKKEQTIKISPLIKKYELVTDYPYLEFFKDMILLHNVNIETKHLYILSKGVKVGTIKGKEIRYELHYARYVSSFLKELNISKEDTISYIFGNPIPLASNKGYLLLKYNNITIDITKSDSTSIKNHYPKGLRKRFD